MPFEKIVPANLFPNAKVSFLHGEPKEPILGVEEV